MKVLMYRNQLVWFDFLTSIRREYSVFLISLPTLGQKRRVEPGLKAVRKFIMS